MTGIPKQDRPRPRSTNSLSPVTGSSKPLGLFGGRFDPVHRAHIKVAQTVADQLNLDEIRWIPCGNPPHKPAIASAPHRLRMVELALNELHDPRMQVDDREVIGLENGKLNYSADTVLSIQQDFPHRELVWIIGEDQLEHFQAWSRWEWLIHQVTLAVCARPNSVSREAANTLMSLGADIRWISMPLDSLSSTELRKRISQQEEVADQIPISVLKYIRSQQLYVSAQDRCADMGK